MFSPDGSRVAFLVGIRPVTKLKVVSLDDGQTITVANSNFDESGGSWGVDGFLYVDGHLEGDGIARVPATGGVLEPVTMPDRTRGEAWHTFPNALPNGKGILFTVDHGADITESEVAVADFAAGTHEILARGAVALYAESGHLLYVTAAGTLMAAPFDQDAIRLTGDAVALVEGVSVNALQRQNLAVSASGTLMYTTESQGMMGGEYYWVRRDGIAEVIDTALTGMGPHFALSPDGTRLVLTHATTTEVHLWIKELDRGPIRRLTFEGPINIAPAWAPDGRSVMFRSFREEGEPSGLYLKRVDGSTTALLVLRHERGVVSGAWSADEEWVIYATEEPNDIFALRPGVDGTPVPLVATPAAETAFSLSPNDRWLAYVSNESGQDEVYVAPFPTTGDGKWLVSRDGGGVPQWAHSGRELFYRNAAGEMMVVDVMEGPSLEIGMPRVLFSAGDYWDVYAVSPDDRRFVMARTADFGVELIVVENFFEVLRERVGQGHD
jgi:serine/threonine-protein kinase